MIYFISKHDTSFKSCSLQECFDYFKEHEYVAADTETTGLNFMTDTVMLLQLGDEKNQYVIDCTTLDIRDCREFLESKKLILHNAKFDLKFLYSNEIYPREVYDTMIAEKILTTGLRTVRVALDKCLDRYFNVTMPKEIRAHIPKLGVKDERVIKYSAMDVEYLHKLKDEQIKKLTEDNLLDCLKLENKLIPTLSYIEFCGFRLDKSQWNTKMKADLKDLMRKEIMLDEFCINLELKDSSYQLDIFGNSSTMVNWKSPPQVIKIFEQLGINVDTFDKKTKRPKKSVEAKVIKNQEHPIIPIYLDFLQAHKRVSTYGKSFLDLVKEYSDNRLRTNFTQILNTGRMSSGGFGTVNFQNIPRVPASEDREREIYERECFVPDEGNVFVVADYSSQLGSLAA